MVVEMAIGTITMVEMEIMAVIMEITTETLLRLTMAMDITLGIVNSNKVDTVQMARTTTTTIIVKEIMAEEEDHQEEVQRKKKSHIQLKSIQTDGKI
uniref:Uncharacterized protein n=1 Tax=Ditylenchus dipsaci TaxID=166011 RepID=A0A915D7N0_9BILA